MNIQEQIKQLEERFQKELSELKEKATQEEKKQEFKVGDWVKIVSNKGNYKTHRLGDIIKITNVGFNGDFMPVVNTEKLPPEEGCVWQSDIRHATPEEIESHLIEEAKKKGFVVGAKVKVKNGVKNSMLYRTMNDWEWESASVFGNREIKEFEFMKGELMVRITGTDDRCLYKMDIIELLPSTPEIEIGNQKVDLGEKIVTVLDKGIHSNRFIDASKLIKDLAFDESVVVTGIMVKKCNGDELLIPSDAINEISSYYEKEGE